MIVLFTDFGLSGPYVGQMKAVLCALAPGEPVIDLFHAAPVFDSRAAAYLLAAYARAIPGRAIFICVVDPGVGGDRAALMVEDGDHIFVGPDNGLFEILCRRAGSARVREITWRPETLLPSFHGRDLFAPVAARLARGQQVETARFSAVPTAPWKQWPDQAAEVLYIDHYGNAVTGLSATDLGRRAHLRAGGRTFGFARTFSAVPPGAAFWYENANGLVELAVNQGHICNLGEITVGTKLEIIVD